MTVSIPFLLRCLLSSSVDAALLLYNCKWCTGWDVRCLLCLHFSGWKKNEIPSELIIIWSAYFTYFLNLKSHESASKIKNKLKKQKHRSIANCSPIHSFRLWQWQWRRPMCFLLMLFIFYFSPSSLRPHPHTLTGIHILHNNQKLQICKFKLN